MLKYARVDASELSVVVHECSSISTLEFVVESLSLGKDRLRWSVIDQACFCWQVASTNKLEFLKWAREVETLRVG